MTISEMIGVAAFYGIFESLGVFGAIAIAWLALPMIFDSLIGEFASPLLLIKALIDQLRKL